MVKPERFIGGSRDMNGRIFIVSWHVLAEDDIRCYVYFGGFVSRFFGEDILNVWAKHYFVKRELNKLRNALKNDEMFIKGWNIFCNEAFTNPKFDHFYEGITGMKRDSNS